MNILRLLKKVVVITAHGFFFVLNEKQGTANKQLEVNYDNWETIEETTTQDSVKDGF